MIFMIQWDCGNIEKRTLNVCQDGYVETMGGAVVNAKTRFFRYLEDHFDFQPDQPKCFDIREGGYVSFKGPDSRTDGKR